MNVYGKKDESYENLVTQIGHYQKKRKLCFRFFSILIGSLIATVISCCPTFYF